MQSYFNHILYASLSHSCKYFFFSHLSSLLLSYLSFCALFFLLLTFLFFISPDFSTFFSFTPISCAFCCNLKFMVFLWLLFVCSANIFSCYSFVVTILDVVVKHHSAILYSLVSWPCTCFHYKDNELSSTSLLL